MTHYSIIYYLYMYTYALYRTCTRMPCTMYNVHMSCIPKWGFCLSNQIADFGLSRDLADENYYVSKGGAIPVKWTAPEAVLYKKYSAASDVWSYGCLLYEVWSVGRKPFEGCDNVQVQQTYDVFSAVPCTCTVYSQLFLVHVQCILCCSLYMYSVFSAVPCTCTVYSLLYLYMQFIQAHVHVHVYLPYFSFHFH